MGELVFPGNKSYGSIRIGAYASLVNGDTITIGNKVYEFRTSGSAAAGHVQVNVGGSGAATAIALQAAIAANQPSVPIDSYVDAVDALVVRLEAHDAGTAGNIAFSASMTGGTNIIDQTSGFLLGGENGKLTHLDSGRYTVQPLDVTAACIMIPTKLAAPKILSIQVFDATGVLKVCTGTFVPSSNRLKYVPAGGTNPAATDVICWSVRD